MAGKSATLAIRIVSDAKGASKGFDDAAGRVDRFQRGLDRASTAATGVLGAVGAVATKAFQDASALEQSSGAVASVYGKHSAAIVTQAKAAATSVGLSQNAYQELSSVLGAQLKGMGYAGEELTQQNKSLIQTGADMAATFGGTTADAVSALSSLMRGERDPIERYGVTINQAAVNAQVLAMGLDTSTPAAKRAAEAQATLALLTQQTKDITGAAAREQGTAASRTQQATAAWEDASAQLGTVLLPIVASAAQKLAVLAGMLMRNKDTVIPLTVGIAGLAAAILVANGVLRVYRATAAAVAAVQGIMAAATGKATAATLAQKVAVVAVSAATKAWAVVQGILNLVMMANPLGIVIVAIMAVIAAVVLAYQKFEGFRNFVQGVGAAIASAFDAVIGAIEWVIDKLSFVGDAAAAVGDFFSASATVDVVPQAGGDLAGVFGAVEGPAPVGVYGASMSALSGGGSTAGQGPRAAGTVVNITVQGAVDPISTARQIRKLLDSESTLTGRSMTLVTR